MKKKQTSSTSFFINICLIALLTGSLDILMALGAFKIAHGGNPFIVLKSIASAAFGPDAMTGGLRAEIAGLTFHFIISFLFTGFFFLIYSNFSIFSRNNWLTAFLYGIFIWVVMNEIVIPLSRAPQLQLPVTKIISVIKSMIILIVAFGIPLTFFASRMTAKNKAKRASRSKLMAVE